MDSEFALIVQTAAMVLGGLLALYTLKRFGWLCGLYEDENRALRTFAIISVVANVGILLIRFAWNALQGGISLR